MTQTQRLRLVGQAVKAADPDTAKMLRAEGRGSLAEMGKYVYEVDIDQFNRIVEDHLDELAYEAGQ